MSKAEDIQTVETLLMALEGDGKVDDNDPQFNDKMRAERLLSIFIKQERLHNG